MQLGLPTLAGTEPPAAGRPARPPLPWRYRLLQALSSYLPLMLMALLGCRHLVAGASNTPQAPGDRPDAPTRQTPDYTMTGFAITRFAPDGQVSLRIAGDVLRHYPATDRLEIDGVRIQATGPDGRSTTPTGALPLASITRPVSRIGSPTIPNVGADKSSSRRSPRSGSPTMSTCVGPSSANRRGSAGGSAA